MAVKEYGIHYIGMLIYASLVKVVEPLLATGEIGPPEIVFTIQRSEKASGMVHEQVVQAYRKMIQCFMVEPVDYAFKPGYPADWEYITSRIKRALLEEKPTPIAGTIKPKMPYSGPLPENMQWQWTEWGLYAYLAIQDSGLIELVSRVGIKEAWLTEEELHRVILASLKDKDEELVNNIIMDMTNCGIFKVRSR